MNFASAAKHQELAQFARIVILVIIMINTINQNANLVKQDIFPSIETFKIFLDMLIIKKIFF